MFLRLLVSGVGFILVERISEDRYRDSVMVLDGINEEIKYIPYIMEEFSIDKSSIILEMDLTKEFKEYYDTVIKYYVYKTGILSNV
jgi:hypothetical protein